MERNILQIFFLFFLLVIIFNPFTLGLLIIFIIFSLFLGLLNGMRFSTKRTYYSSSKVREFEFYKLSFLLVARLIAIFGSMNGEQLNYINFLINSLNLSEREKTNLYNTFHASITRYRNLDKILFTLKLSYFQHNDFFLWLLDSLNKISSLANYKNLEAINFIRYVAEFLEVDLDNNDFHKNVNIEIINPYEVLGLESFATDDEIKKNYKKLVIKYHPDKFENDLDKQKKANDKFLKIQDAYSRICRERNIK